MTPKHPFCRALEPELVAVAAGEAVASAVQRVEEHTRACAPCRHELGRYRAIEAVARGLREDVPPAEDVAASRAALQARLADLKSRVLTYGIVPSPLGNILVARSEQGVSLVEYLGEATEPWSYLKSPYYRPLGYPDGIYRVGPLARLNVCDRMGTPLADRELAEFRGLGEAGRTSSFLYHQARLIEILASVDHGLYVQSVSGLHSGTNPVSGDFSVGAVGLVIRDGALAEPVREVTIASTLQRILHDIAVVGADLTWLPGGAAGMTLLVADMSVSGA